MRSLGLELLPDEALGRIFGFLDDKAQHCFIRVSKALNTIKVIAPFDRFGVRYGMVSLQTVQNC